MTNESNNWVSPPLVPKYSYYIRVKLSHSFPAFPLSSIIHSWIHPEPNDEWMLCDGRVVYPYDVDSEFWDMICEKFDGRLPDLREHPVDLDVQMNVQKMCENPIPPIPKRISDVLTSLLILSCPEDIAEFCKMHEELSAFIRSVWKTRWEFSRMLRKVGLLQVDDEEKQKESTTMGKASCTDCIHFTVCRFVRDVEIALKRFDAIDSIDATNGETLTVLAAHCAKYNDEG